MSKFLAFPQLSAEIRLKIWNMCLYPPSLIPADLNDYIGIQTLEEFDAERRNPPSMLLACRESYEVAKYGAFITLCRTRTSK